MWERGPQGGRDVAGDRGVADNSAPGQAIDGRGRSEAGWPGAVCRRLCLFERASRGQGYATNSGITQFALFLPGNQQHVAAHDLSCADAAQDAR